eukprot:14094098-Alexandrium_andersonii.AAC.1
MLAQRVGGARQDLTLQQALPELDPGRRPCGLADISVGEAGLPKVRQDASCCGHVARDSSERGCPQDGAES